MKLNLSPRILTVLLVLVLCALTNAKDYPHLDNSSLVWGPYRPNLYFGVRPRIPKTLLIGLMWANVDTQESIPQNLRHTCEQNDGMVGYGWTTMTREGGTQEIPDFLNKINLTTEFVKIPGGQYGGNWGVRVKGIPRIDAPEDLHTTVVVYIGLEGDSKLECIRPEGRTANQGAVECQGNVPGLGGFKIHLPIDAHSDGHLPPPHITRVKSLDVPEDKIWEAKSIFAENLKISADSRIHDGGVPKNLSPYSILSLEDEPGSGNMHFVQKTFEGDVEFDILFSSDSAPSPISSTDLTKRIRETMSSFSARFGLVFGPKVPYRSASHIEFSQSLLSNLVGGMGYFYGDWKVDRSNAPQYEETATDFWEKAAAARAQVSSESTLTTPSELFTMVPSRPFFPRGFLWDEGFHLLVVLDWDIDLALEVVKSWFSLMDEDGWIAREQILGPEARSKVPPEFQVQYPQYANPPTLFLVLAAFVDRISGKVPYAGAASQYLDSAEMAKKSLADLYPLLKRHYEWFRRTQAGDLKSYHRPPSSASFAMEGYRWRGRTSTHTLTSGLDDYPRAQPPHPGELHLDAVSWVGSMAGAFRKIADFLDEDTKIFSEQQQAIKNSLDTLHWSVDDKAYCDATIENERHVYVCHRGYISLFPFLVGLLGTNHQHLGSVLDLMRDEEELWSPYGLRSLSRKSPLYGSDENYWRSPIWININYLAIEQLLDLAQQPGLYQQKARAMYTELRHNIISTVYNSWRITGFAWEQYNPETGAGQRTQHFTGWTALVVKIMAFPDLDEITKPGSDWNGNETAKWKRKGGMMIVLIVALGIVLRRKLMIGWRQAMGWTRIHVQD